MQSRSVGASLALACRRAMVLACLALLPLSACADPVRFSFSSTGDGHLGTTNFTDRAYEVTFLGNTDDIGFDFGSNVPAIQGLFGSIEIDGVGGAVFSTPLMVFNNRDNATVGFGDPDVGDYWDQTAAPLSAYGLDTSFGPITSAGVPNLVIGFESPTDHGDVFMENPMQRPGTFQAELNPVPEPGTLVIFGVAIFLLKTRPKPANQLNKANS